MMHKVRLSNGQVVGLEERSESLVISHALDADRPVQICEISKAGVLADPRADFAPEDLTAGLHDGRTPPVVHEVWIKFGADVPGQPDHYVFETLGELNAFLTGITKSSECGGDFEQFDSHEAVAKYMQAVADVDT